MSLKISISVLAASFAIASLAASVGAGAAAAAAAAAGDKQQSPIARNGVDTSHRLYNYAGPQPFAPVRYRRPGYTDNHDAWMNW